MKLFGIFPLRFNLRSSFPVPFHPWCLSNYLKLTLGETKSISEAETEFYSSPSSLIRSSPLPLSLPLAIGHCHGNQQLPGRLPLPQQGWGCGGGGEKEEPEEVSAASSWLILSSHHPPRGRRLKRCCCCRRCRLYSWYSSGAGKGGSYRTIAN